MEIYSDFKQVGEVSSATINKYAGILPQALMTVWQDYGFGTFMGGYLSVINPDDLIPLVEATYVRSKGAIPILTSGMGDLILFEIDDNQDSTIMMVNYRKGKTKVLASKYALFIRFLEEDAFKQKAMDWAPYPEAVKKYGAPAYEECFGYVPLLGLGGPEKVEHLDKVNLKEHILLISRLLGPIA